MTRSALILTLLLACTVNAQAVTNTLTWTNQPQPGGTGASNWLTRLEWVGTNQGSGWGATNWQLLATVPTNVTSFATNNLTQPGWQYLFRALTTNSIAPSEPSNIYPWPRVLPPFNLNVTFNVEYSTNLSTGWADGGVVTIPIPATQFPGVTAETPAVFVRLKREASAVTR